MVCGFCSTGCGLTVHLHEGQAINLSPTTDYPVNRGMACPKGWEALTVLDAPDRATAPLLRGEDGRRRPVDWHEAMATMTARFRAIQAEHGDDAVAFLSTGQIATEEMALLGAVAKFGMGMVHGDGNTRQCMASAVVAYKQAFGFDAPPYTYKDLEESDCIILIGANPCIAHPVLWERVTRNPHNPEIIVIDPRRTETAMASTLHLPVRPKSDLTLLYGLAHLLIEQGAIDRSFIDAHTQGFDEFTAFVRRFDPEFVASETGLDAETIVDTAGRIARGERVSFWWTMGVNQSHQGVKTAQAAINLALMTGNIGRPGTGANSITGQCNAMGSRLFSNTTNLLGGHDFTDPAHRAEVAALLDIPEDRIPRCPSLVVRRHHRGRPRGEDPRPMGGRHQPGPFLGRPGGISRDPGQARLPGRAGHVLLDRDRRGRRLTAASGGLGREGRDVHQFGAPGRSDQEGSPRSRASTFGLSYFHARGCIITAVDELFAEWKSPEAVFQILKRLSKGRPCDITGIDDYRALDESRGVQWPYPSENPDPTPERRLFTDGRFYHPDGRARFLFEEPRPLPEPTGGGFPFQLLTGRGSAAQWHTQTRTAKSDVLRKLYPRDPYVEINPADAENLGLSTGRWAVVESRRGSASARAFVTPTMPAGQLFLPMHDGTTNQLTLSSFDPESRQPAYKACAARVRPAVDGEIPNDHDALPTH